jgi:predicted RNA-binding Zn ribbon-like protein
MVMPCYDGGMSTSPSLPGWVQEIETKPAPMPLLVVQAFVNTWEAETGIDELADEASTARWFGQAGLVDPADVVVPDVTFDGETVRAVRDGLRALLVHNGGGPPPDASVLSDLPVHVEASVDGEGRVRLHPQGALAWAARLLLIVRDAQHDGSWRRLKACRNDECQWAFYDRSHAGRGAWCDMAVCGNRIKNRNLRSRRAAGAVRASAKPTR